MGRTVSVVIPTHNRCTLLKRAIESVRNQTYSDLEIIVVSDASTDGTDSLVEDLIRIDERIEYIKMEKPEGGNAARNRGIHAAKGEYIAFLDDDDEWLPDKLKLQLNVISENKGIGLVYTGVHVIYVNEKVEYNTKARESGDLSKRILLDNCIGTTSTVMCRKEVLLNVGLFDTSLRALQDYDLWIRCCQRYAVGIVPMELIYYYNYTSNKKDNTQVSSSTEKYAEAIEYINKKYDSLFNKLPEDKKREKRLNDLALLINKSLRNENRKDARKYILKYIGMGKLTKGFLYYLLSYTSYKNILRIRSIL